MGCSTNINDELVWCENRNYGPKSATLNNSTCDFSICIDAEQWPKYIRTLDFHYWIATQNPGIYRYVGVINKKAPPSYLIDRGLGEIVNTIKRLDSCQEMIG